MFGLDRHLRVGVLVVVDNTTMDALAGYGSDDDDSSSAHSEGLPPATGGTGKSALEQLIASSDSDEEDTSAVPSNNAAVSGTIEEPATKKARVESNNTDNLQQSVQVLQLPEPALAKDDNDSWILWKTNHLLQQRLQAEAPLPLENPPSTIQIRDNLQRLARNIGKDKSSWAEHLRTQQEFHNPHFFASVVEHFGIATPLASFAGDAKVKDYERELFPLTTTTTTTTLEGT